MVSWFYILAILGVSTSVSCAVKLETNTGLTDPFDKIEPAAKLTWTPCYETFLCAKLEMPLDYSNKTLGTTSVPLIKQIGKNATADSQSIVLISGGPGGSGVELLLENQALTGQVFGEQYNVISYNPRGVNNSDLHLDFFSGDKEARETFNRLHNTGATNTSTSSLEEQYYSSSIYGDWCNHAVKTKTPYGYHVTTAAVARDLRHLIEAEAKSAGQNASDAKLWAYGVSYGTLVGQTFASMFPDRVGRMILDGVVNADQYYENDWRDNPAQMDEAMEVFSTSCHAAGSEDCSFWGPTAANITARMEGLMRQLQNQPVALSGVQTDSLPAMVTSSDLKALFLDAIYSPAAKFPGMADVLQQLEQGNATALSGLDKNFYIQDDARLAIQCADVSGTNKLTTLEEFRDYVDYTTAMSKWVGDVYPIYLETILCRTIQPKLSDSMRFKGPVGGHDGNTSFPIMFTSNTIDPITPLISAWKMSDKFPGSTVLVQEAVGHTVLGQGGSPCYAMQIQAYLQGEVPSMNTTCPQVSVPFKHPSAK